MMSMTFHIFPISFIFPFHLPQFLQFLSPRLSFAISTDSDCYYYHSNCLSLISIPFAIFHSIPFHSFLPFFFSCRIIGINILMWKKEVKGPDRLVSLLNYTSKKLHLVKSEVCTLRLVLIYYQWFLSMFSEWWWLDDEFVCQMMFAVHYNHCHHLLLLSIIRTSTVSSSALIILCISHSHSHSLTTIWRQSRVRFFRMLFRSWWDYCEIYTAHEWLCARNR